MIKKSKKQYKHGLACYPISYRGHVVSENKICIQFNNPQIKVRPMGELDDLIKPSWGDKALPIDRLGTDVGFIAVGIPLEVHEDLLFNLLESYEEHINRFDKRLLSMLEKARDKLNRIINGSIRSTNLQ